MKIVNYDLCGYSRADISAFDAEVEKLGFPRRHGVFYTPSREDGGEWVFAPISDEIGEVRLASLILLGKVWLADAFVADQVITGHDLELWNEMDRGKRSDPSVEKYMAFLKKATSIKDIEDAIERGSPYWHAWISESGKGQDHYSSWMEACYLEVIIFGIRKWRKPELRHIGDEDSADREFEFADLDDMRAYKALKEIGK